MANLSNIWNTILGSIASLGYVQFAVMVIVNIILYRIHPVMGFLGTLFLFAILTGIL
jgi:hypothetical protein